MSRNQIQISIDYLKNIFKLSQTQINILKSSILFILNKSKVPFNEDKNY